MSGRWNHLKHVPTIGGTEEVGPIDYISAADVPHWLLVIAETLPLPLR